MQTTDEMISSLLNGKWIAKWPAPDIGVPVQALAIASDLLSSKALLIKAKTLSMDLRRETQEGTIFSGFGRGEEETEWPFTVMTFIDALGALYLIEKDPSLLSPIRSAGDWFLGVNRRKAAMYDFKRGGCFDALLAIGPNQNKGAEATISCLISFLTLYELAGAQVAHRPSSTLH